MMAFRSPSDLRLATWTTSDEAVTCAKCIGIILRSQQGD